MEINLRLAHPKSALQLKNLLVRKLKRSRFDVPAYNVHYSNAGDRCRHGRLRIYGIRLKARKPYHGAGPVPSSQAMMRRGWGRGGRKIAKMSFLEGADWVEFNDLLNDFCDELGICANIFSKVCSIRRGWFRRIAYESETLGRQHRWQRFPPPEHYMGVVSRTGPFPMSRIYSGGSNSVHLAPAGIYRNVYIRWSPRLEDIRSDQLITSMIEAGKIKKS